MSKKNNDYREYRIFIDGLNKPLRVNSSRWPFKEIVIAVGLKLGFNWTGSLVVEYFLFQQMCSNKYLVAHRSIMIVDGKLHKTGPNHQIHRSVYEHLPEIKHHLRKPFFGSKKQMKIELKEFKKNIIDKMITD